MDLLRLQQELIQFTESEGFVSLESFREELLNSEIEYLDEFIKFKTDNYNSQTLFRTERFEIKLLCWKPLQKTVKHAHPENGCLMKIIEGKLVEEKFEQKNKVENIYKKGDVSYTKPSELHILKNSEINSVSLHIYSPSGFYNSFK